MATNYASVEYVGNGTATDFTFSFTVHAFSALEVLVDGVVTTAYTLPTASLVRFTVAPAPAAAIVIRRSSVRSNPLVDFTGGAVLTEADLDNAHLHALAMGQENAEQIERNRLDKIVLEGNYNTMLAALQAEIGDAGVAAAAAAASASASAASAATAEGHAVIATNAKTSTNLLVSEALTAKIAAEDAAAQAQGFAQSTLSNTVALIHDVSHIATAGQAVFSFDAPVELAADPHVYMLGMLLQPADYVVLESVVGGITKVTGIQLVGAADAGDIVRLVGYTRYNTLDVYTRAEAAAALLGDQSNLLMNGCFRVWQRGATHTGTGDNALVADRWRVRYNTSGTPQTWTCSRQETGDEGAVYGVQSPNFLRLSAAGLDFGRSYFGIEQKIEDCRPLAGRTVTIKGKCRTLIGQSELIVHGAQYWGIGGSGIEYTVKAPGIPVGALWTNFEAEVAFAPLAGQTLGAGHYTRINIQLDGANNPNHTQQIDFADVVVLVGDAEGSFRLRPFGQELALCQRYYTKSYLHGVPEGTPNATGPAGFYGSGDSDWKGGSIAFPVTMRTTPTVTLRGYVTGNPGVVMLAGGTGSGVEVSGMVTHQQPSGFLALCGPGDLGALTAAGFITHWAANAEL